MDCPDGQCLHYLNMIDKLLSTAKSAIDEASTYQDGITCKKVKEAAEEKFDDFWEGNN